MCRSEGVTLTCDEAAECKEAGGRVKELTNLKIYCFQRPRPLRLASLIGRKKVVSWSKQAYELVKVIVSTDNAY